MRLALRPNLACRALLRRGVASSAPRLAPSSSAVKGLAALTDAQVRGRNVFVRVDFNVPLSKSKPVQITDDTRIRESLATVEALSQRGARVILASHLGRPKAGPEDKLRMTPVAARLGELLRAKPAFANVSVTSVADCIGPDVAKAAAALQNGNVLVLENTRFRKDEEKNNADFAKALAQDTGATVYVNDAFGAAHRAHASTAGIRKFISGPAVAGLLLQRELQYLCAIRDAPPRPFAVVLGGAKVADKLPVIEALLGKAKTVLIGGGMAFPFLKAQGVGVGASLCDDASVAVATHVLALARQKGVDVRLPREVVIAQSIAADAPHRAVPATAGIPDGWMGVDIGPAAVAEFADALAGAKSVFWNGPMGCAEVPAFAAGTNALAKHIAALTAKGCATVVGGGDSVAAVAAAGLTGQMTHVSTGGGASLELLEGAALPGVDCLDRA